jgi:hypothetical protein
MVTAQRRQILRRIPRRRGQRELTLMQLGRVGDDLVKRRPQQLVARTSLASGHGLAPAGAAVEAVSAPSEWRRWLRLTVEWRRPVAMVHDERWAVRR